MRFLTPLIPWLGLLAACSTGPPTKVARNRSVEHRCQVRDIAEGRVTEVVSRRDGYSLLLPGNDWNLRCGRSVALEGTSSGPLHASVLALEVVDPVDDGAFLRWLYRESADDTRKHGLDVTKAHFSEIGDALVLSYEVLGANVDGTRLRILHAFTAQQRPDGTIYTFHVSWVGPEETFQPGVVPGLQRLATNFHLLPIN